ncbi:MAG: GntR family transcriptional regulator [Paracoccaceae bacterium]|jgi:DNA-binding GntR family transcriptional regulator|nr:MAG: GntR family transcriptional regulator [Rhodobacter sp. BACL10 MAG-120910-bin24]KRP21621.1 MAG: GntR family transcriptional regulator [Rhodobacter sp. BACL10 MAG-120419-bin15]MDP5368584.1 GntR family transcriptional regulator [Paracoccaceae bacterium]HAG25700.1 GntR family transcriptional regulator [Rhodobacter sp.]NQV67238.1 GntR family transcriptional regulator [Paracoccaceae bacterium]|tara:strand:+ start:1866 stop:2579 length:714 start_codon:yes stop_codon:yes gene_type:complete
MSIADHLSPISVNFTLKDHTYDVLRQAILGMNIYHPDVDLRLDERNLAEQLGISRTPIREALARLSQDGLVTILPRKGVYVVRKTRQEIMDMIITWAALESMAARLAAIHATEAALKDLRKFAMKHSAHAARAELAEYSDANILFHQKIMALSGCKLLSKTADDLFMHMHAVRKRAMGESDRASRSVVDHMKIIEALDARDGEAASKLVLEHTMRLHDHVKRTWTRLEQIDQKNSVS